MLTLLIAGDVMFFRFIAAGPGGVHVDAAVIPAPGQQPLYVPAAHAYLVNLAPGAGGTTSIPGSERGGLLALSNQVFGCRVQVRGRTEYDGTASVFYEGCAGTWYSAAGVRAWGARWHLNTYPIVVAPDGSISIRPESKFGGDDNPQRTVPVPSR